MKKDTNFIYLLRFIAAILVVVNHYSPIRNVLVNNGGEAVSFFFLLSGFILVVAYEKQIVQNNLALGTFYVKRIARIFPLYLLALFLTLSYHFLIQYSHSHLAFKLPLEVLMIQSWFYSGSINYPAWSISCEFFFYLLFPLYILKLKNRSLRSAIYIAITLLLTIMATSYFLESMSYPFLRPDLKGGFLYQHPIVRLPMFFWGNVLGFMYIKNVTIPTKQLILMLLTGCLCIFLWTFKPLVIGMSLKQLGLLFIYTVLIVSLLQNESFSIKYLNNKHFTLLGDISYGVYLLQFPISSFVLIYTNDFTTWQSFTVFIIILLVASYFVHEYFEKPLRSKIVDDYTPRKAVKVYSYTKK